MAWRVEWDERAVKELKSFDPQVQRTILKYIRQKFYETDVDPRVYGKPLVFNKKGLWRFRIGDCRLICLINDQKVTITIVSVGHRKNVYE